ncbi:MAG: OB-fold domain-containing protein [Actinomycetota bacterium]|nr:OB-fold domain-containing protein [Actinomycetota bacterium]
MTTTAAPQQPQPAPIVPDPTPTAQPFWDALAAGRVDLQHCAECGQWVYYPRSRCSACMSPNLVWETISGAGTLYTYTIARQPTTPAFSEAPDLVLAVVQLDEGPKLTTSLENVTEDGVRIGMRVKPYFHRAGDLTLLRYQPA